MNYSHHFSLEEAYSALYEEIIEFKVVFALGAVDRGKTTYITYLVNKAVQKGKSVAVIDSDVGQSEIGPPTTIGVGFTKTSVEKLSDIKPIGLYFVGAISPEGHFLEMITGVHLMLKQAEQLQPDIILIDTTGLIHGCGIELKKYKIELVRPDALLCFEEEEELQPILNSLTYIPGRIYRIRCSNLPKKTDRAQRRNSRFEQYFSDATNCTLNLNTVKVIGKWLGKGKSLCQKKLSEISRIIDDVVLYAQEYENTLYLVLPDILNRARLLPLYYLYREIYQESQDSFCNLLVGVSDGAQLLGIGKLKQLDFHKQEITLLLPQNIKSSVIKIVKLGEYRLV